MGLPLLFAGSLFLLRGALSEPKVSLVNLVCVENLCIENLIRDIQLGDFKCLESFLIM